MDLFEPLFTKITIPEFVITNKKVSNNRVQRYANKSFPVEVETFDSDRRGFYKFKTSLQEPYNIIYIKKWNSRGSVPTDVCCLKFMHAGDIFTLNETTKLTWLHHPLAEEALSPESIVSSWAGLFRFKQDLPELSQRGLRLPQIGALHAISAHFATDRKLEPATVVLPTGTGKTETMLSCMLYQQCARILVIVPSQTLREQIGNKFLSLGCLPELGIVPLNCKLPYVVKMKVSLKKVADAQSLVSQANVIIATASILHSSNQRAVDTLCEQCSHLFVDEAHHISAKSWAEVRDRFVDRGLIQFTATPFRNDGDTLGGKIIYNYTMGEAQRAGYFRQIFLNPVEEYYDGEADRTIAEKAIDLLKRDLVDGFDHLLMARVRIKERADTLLSLYQEVAPEFNPIVVHSDHTQAQNKYKLDALHARNSRVIICVDMLGEGFDLPNLKIAAIHDHHKSLAITLQFIGRFTRAALNEKIGDASVVVNIADPKVDSGLDHLYSQGADWDVVLRRLSESRIEREIQLQEVVDALKHGGGNLHQQISLWNIRPKYSAVLYQTNCKNWHPKAFKDDLPKFDEYWHAIAEDKNLLIVLAVQSTPVKWGHFKDLKDINYKLLIAYWEKKRNALFVFSNDYNVFRVDQMVKRICGEKTFLLAGERIFNVFNGIEYPLVRNLGASQIGAISFTQYFGPNVTEGLDLIESSQSSLSNIAGLGYENGDRVIWGCSEKKGKIWSPKAAGSVSDWCEWVTLAWDKVINGEIDEANITRDFLRPVRINQNHSEYPVSAQWGEYIQSSYEDHVVFIFNNNPVPFFLIDLSIVGKDEDGAIFIQVSSETNKSVNKFSIHEEAPGFSYELIDGDPIYIQTGVKDAVEFSSYMISDPIMIHYVNGSFSYNCFLVDVPGEIGLFPADRFVVGNWDGIDIKTESMDYEQKSFSVQYRIYENIREQYDVIINDDGSGEAADLVALKLVGDEIVLCLIHCKYSSEDSPGARVGDLYEVCGQAQRSIRWKHLGMNYLYERIKRREQLWKDRGYSRFLKGQLRDLLILRNRARTTQLRLEVSIVQPGVSLKKVNNEILKLLGCTATYIKKTTQADLLVHVSE